MGCFNFHDNCILNTYVTIQFIRARYLAYQTPIWILLSRLLCIVCSRFEPFQ